MQNFALVIKFLLLIIINPVRPKVMLKNYCGEWVVILFVNDPDFVVKVTCYHVCPYKEII
jgi:hypothetical protein